MNRKTDPAGLTEHHGAPSEPGWLKVPAFSSPQRDSRGHHSLKCSRPPVRRVGPFITTFLAGNQNCSMLRWICPANEDGRRWKPPVENPQLFVVEHFLALWRGLLDYSRLTAGCAVVAVTVAANGDDELLAHAGAIFRTWTDLLADLCAAGGVELSSARLLAVTVIAATEGVVALCRAERSMEPFEEVQTVLVSLTKSLGTK